MSYCRFIEGDVYMYPTVSHGNEVVCCCMCSLDAEEPFVYLDTLEDARKHLLKHIDRGDHVPARAFMAIQEEIEERDNHAKQR